MTFPNQTEEYREHLAERRDRVARLTREGRSAKEIAVILRVTERTVVRDRKAIGCAKPFVGTPLTNEERRRALQLLGDGCSARDTALTIGRGHNTIARNFPDRVWSRQQCAEHVAAIMRARHQMEARR